MIGRDELGRLVGAAVVDADGHHVGEVGGAFLGDDDQAHWVTVRTGLFGRRESFVPLDEAQLDENVLRVPYGKAKVRDAPHFDPESPLTEEEESELHSYYGRTRPPGAGMGKHVAAPESEQIGEVDELPEERPRFAEPIPPQAKAHFEAEGVMLHPDEEDYIRRHQIDFNGEVGRDRV